MSGDLSGWDKIVIPFFETTVEEQWLCGSLNGLGYSDVHEYGDASSQMKEEPPEVLE